MIRRPPSSTRTDTLFPYTTLFRSFESAGAIQAQIGDAIFPVHAAALPEGHGTVKLLRLHDGRSVLCYPIEAVIDIVRMPDAMQPAAAPGLIAGVALIGADPVELIDPFWLLEESDWRRGGKECVSKGRS